MPRLSSAIDRANTILRAHGTPYRLREGHRYPDGSTLVDVLTKEVIALRQMRGKQTLQE